LFPARAAGAGTEASRTSVLTSVRFPLKAPPARDRSVREGTGIRPPAASGFKESADPTAPDGAGRFSTTAQDKRSLHPKSSGMSTGEGGSRVRDVPAHSPQRTDGGAPCSSIALLRFSLTRQTSLYRIHQMIQSNNCISSVPSTHGPLSAGRPDGKRCA